MKVETQKRKKHQEWLYRSIFVPPPMWEPHTTRTDISIRDFVLISLTGLKLYTGGG